MWKIVLAFVIFAALAMWMLSKGGNVDMGGEKHGIDVTHEPAASAPVLAPSVPASAASQ